MQAKFWKIIDDARKKSKGNTDKQVKLIGDALAKLTEKEILAFDAEIYGLMDQSYRGRLWGAAYLINGGCSDDGFDYFRGWLIAQGKKVFEAAIANPDSLAAFDIEDVEESGMLSVAAHAYKKKTKKDDFYDLPRKKAAEDGTDGNDMDDELAEWSEDGDGVPKKMKKLFPKLWKKFGDDL